MRFLLLSLCAVILTACATDEGPKQWVQITPQESRLNAPDNLLNDVKTIRNWTGSTRYQEMITFKSGGYAAMEQSHNGGFRYPPFDDELMVMFGKVNLFGKRITEDEMNIQDIRGMRVIPIDRGDNKCLAFTKGLGDRTGRAFSSGFEAYVQGVTCTNQNQENFVEVVLNQLETITLKEQYR